MATALRLLSCVEGHFWESPEASPVPACPVCGGAPESLPLLAPAPSAADSGPVPVATAAAPRLPRPVVPGYEIVEERGRTVTGVAVYVAKQELVRRRVLLKVVLAAEDRGQRAWGALRGEAVALGTISHPNVVQFYQAGERNRELFYNALEFVDGPTLAQNWSAKPLPFRQAAAIVEVLAGAVHYAHELGIVHRALRPGAVHLQVHKSDDGKVTATPPFCLVHTTKCLPKLTDFGLARRPAEGEVNDLDLQQGLPSYLAPEQVWGRAKEIGPATDIYALGAILYELVSGVPPFAGPTVSDTLDLIQTRPALRPGKHRRGVPAELAAICAKCLEKQPRNRYQSAENLADDLRRYRERRAVSALRTGLLRRMWYAARRRPGVTFLVVLAVALALALWLALSSSRHPTYRSTRLPFALLSGLTPDQRAQRQRGDESYVQNLRLAQELVDAGHVEPAKRLLEHFPPQGREWEWYVLWQKAVGAARPSVTCEFGPFRAIACSPDGHRIAVPERHGGFSCVNVWRDFAEQRSYMGGRPGPYVTAMAWYPDGKQIQILDGHGLFFSTSDDSIRLVELQPSLFSHRLSTLNCCSADGSCWASALLEDNVLSIRVGQQISSSFNVPGAEITALAYCPAKGLVATGPSGAPSHFGTPRRANPWN
jgi:hypothetical protein